MVALYNEHEQFCSTWLRKLIVRGQLTPGLVDQRDVRLLSPRDLVQYDRVHFFAGIGGWDLALQIAGWPDTAPAIWTGSCPCQPFSIAGKRKGTDDKRHLWPDWFELIRQCKPSIIFGEQVASPDGLEWLSTVASDLEAQDYSFGAADLCAASVGAPHIRQRLYFMAVSNMRRCEIQRIHLQARGPLPEEKNPGSHGTTSVMGAAVEPVSGRRSLCATGEEGTSEIVRDEARRDRISTTASSQADVWRSPQWIQCADGKSRPIEPGTLPLADGVPARMGRLRAYGNSIVPQVAAAFITASIQAIQLDGPE
jgi:DNA (cytosine-5)-methyltransferase 1